MDLNKDRRQFFLHVGSLVGLALLSPPILSSEVFGQERRRSRPAEGGAAGTPGAGEDLPMVEPGKGNAVALNYVHKHSDIKDPALKVERNGVPFEKQFCNNCVFYTKHGMKKGEEVGKCQIFANQLVKSTAWCSSWAKKT